MKIITVFALIYIYRKKKVIKCKRNVLTVKKKFFTVIIHKTFILILYSLGNYGRQLLKQNI